MFQLRYFTKISASHCAILQFLHFLVALFYKFSTLRLRYFTLFTDLDRAILQNIHQKSTLYTTIKHIRQGGGIHQNMSRT